MEQAGKPVQCRQFLRGLIIKILKVKGQEKTRRSGFNRALTNSIVLKAKQIEIRRTTRLLPDRFARQLRPLQQRRSPPTYPEHPGGELDL